jgi:hypothetical protein
MTQNHTVPEPRHMQTHRSGASRKLLSRKAGDRAMAAQGEALEDVFPDASSSETAEQAIVSPALGAFGQQQSPDPATPAIGVALKGPDQLAAEDASAVPIEARANTSAADLSWSEEDERAFLTMAARRKASGYQRRGRAVGGQVLRVGSITPNPGTVVATIVELFNTRNAMARTELLDAIAGASFSNAKAKPADRSWANGYVAGALRDGFLAVATADEAGVETSPAVSL